MKIKIIAIITTVIILSLAGCTRENDYIDMNTIVGYSSADDGLLIYTDDGNEYFLETEKIP